MQNATVATTTLHTMMILYQTVGISLLPFLASEPHCSNSCYHLVFTEKLLSQCKKLRTYLAVG